MDELSNVTMAAIKAQGLTQTEAANICGISDDTLRTRSKDPQEFRLKELLRLYRASGPTARDLIKGMVDALFLTC